MHSLPVCKLLDLDWIWIVWIGHLSELKLVGTTAKTSYGKSLGCKYIYITKIEKRKHKSLNNSLICKLKLTS